jgi:hypothetical protein
MAVHRDEIDVARLSGVAFACKESDGESTDNNISLGAHHTKERN